jgi:hypothetical protein
MRLLGFVVKQNWEGCIASPWSGRIQGFEELSRAKTCNLDESSKCEID